MNKYIKIIFTIFLYLLGVMSVSIMVYYEFYLGIYGKEIIAKKESLIIDEKIEVEEKLEETKKIIEVLNKSDSEEIKQIGLILNNITKGPYNININFNIESVKRINEILGGDYMKENLENYTQINIFFDGIFHKIYFSGKFNGVEYNFIFLRKENNFNYSIIKADMDGIIALYDLKNYKRYKYNKFNINTSKIENISFFLKDKIGNLIDQNIGKKAEDNLIEIIKVIGNVKDIFKKNNNGFDLTIDNDIKMGFIHSINDSTTLTLGQKSEVKKDLYKLYNFTKGLTFSFRNDNYINIEIPKTTELFFSGNIEIKTYNKKLKIPKNFSIYRKTKELKEIQTIFFQENPILYRFLHGDTMIDILIKE